MPTKEELCARFAYDPATGLLTWKNGPRNLIGREFGFLDTSTGYRVGTIHGHHQYAHRVIWMMLNGPIPDGYQIDHIDGDRLNNRIANFRCVPQKENTRNRRLSTNNTSGVVGVTYSKRDRGWYAQIHIDGRHINLGLFKTFEDAVRARQQAQAEAGFHDNHGRAA